MELIVEKSGLTGTIPMPGSKSHTIRALVIASLAEGTSVIEAPLDSRDTQAAVRVCRSLGAEIETGVDWRVKGIGGRIIAPEDVLDVANSGTTLYITMATAALGVGESEFDGDAQTRARPVQPLIDALNDLGAKVRSRNNDGRVPLVVRGRMSGGRTAIECPTSQYLTSLLLNCPLADGDTEIEVLYLNERPYVEITLKWLDEQGIVYQRDEWRSIKIKGGQKYKSFKKRIPADFSSATFFLCAGAITGEEVVLEGLDMNDSQGDKAVVDYLKRMGASIVVEDSAIRIKKSELHGCEIDLNATPDALPAMAVIGCFAEGETRLVNVPQARLKETDRISVMNRELSKMGADIEEREDGLIVRKSSLKGAVVDGHDDHRVVMALTVAGLGAEGTTTISKAESIDITFPNFVELMQSLGAKIRVED